MALRSVRPSPDAAERSRNPMRDDSQASPLLLCSRDDLRDLVVPQADEDGEQKELAEGVADAEEARSDEVASASVGQRVARVPHRPGKQRRGVRRYYTWAELLRRVFGVEVFTCPNCGGKRRLLAAIQDPDSIQRVLRSLGLSGEVPELAPARAPPSDGWFGA
jgi:hypothetical protein